jgi:hypothetical protein
MQRAGCGGKERGRRNHFIECETTVVSHLLGRGDPCTQYQEKKMWDFVLVRESFLGTK